MKRITVDPPSGWKYGFPRVWDQEKEPDFRKFLIDSGYPEKDVDFGMKWMRCWAVPEEGEDEKNNGRG